MSLETKWDLFAEWNIGDFATGVFFGGWLFGYAEMKETRPDCIEQSKRLCRDVVEIYLPVS